jgi:hypothetical protein
MPDTGAFAGDMEFFWIGTGIGMYIIGLELGYDGMGVKEGCWGTRVFAHGTRIRVSSVMVNEHNSLRESIVRVFVSCDLLSTYSCMVREYKTSSSKNMLF